MLFGAGCAPDAEAWEDEAAQKLVAQAPTEVLGEGAKVDIVPNGLEHFHDMSKVSGVIPSKLATRAGGRATDLGDLCRYTATTI